MRLPLVGRSMVVAAVLCAYPMLTLYPFNWKAPETLSNGAVLVPGGGISFPSRGIALSDAPPGWLDTAISSGTFVLELRARSMSTDQTGPARLLTISADPWTRNLTIGQEGRDLVIRMRTPWTDSNGMPELLVPGVFKCPQWVELELLVEPGILELRIDGERRLRTTLPRMPTRSWDRGHRLALGNELTLDRPWLGDIERAVVRTASGSEEYAGPHSTLTLPRQLRIFHRAPHLVPFRAVDPGDALANLIFFLPLGFVLGRGQLGPVLRSARHAILFAFTLSLGLEALQLFVPQRQPSVDDLILNTAGAAIGVMLAVRFRARRSRPRSG